MKRSLMSLYYHAWRYVLRAIVPTFLRMKVSGLQYVPKIGPCILVGNHISMADPVCLLAYVPRHLRFFVKAEAFQAWPLSWVLPPGDPIKVNRGRADRQALRQAEQHLKWGNAVMIYAEGTRSRSGVAQEARAGVVFLAQRTGVPLVPVAISGTERVFSKHFPWFRRAQVQMTFGAPFRLEDLGTVTRTNRDQLAQAVMGRVVAFLPPAYPGAYDGEVVSLANAMSASQAGAPPREPVPDHDMQPEQR